MTHKVKNLVIGSILGASALSLGYLIGKAQGINEGRIGGKTEIVDCLGMEAWDARENAKYAGSAQEQAEILKISGDVHGVLELLDRKGYLKDVPNYSKAAAMPATYGPYGTTPLVDNQIGVK